MTQGQTTRSMGQNRDSDNEEEHGNDYNPGDWFPLRQKEVNGSREGQTGASKALIILFFLNVGVGYPGVHFAIISDIVHVR